VVSKSDQPHKIRFLKLGVAYFLSDADNVSQTDELVEKYRQIINESI
jgi:hypothetical protein